MGGMTVSNRLAVVRGAPLSQPSKLGFTARLAYFNQARPSIHIDRKYGPREKYFHEKAGFLVQLILCPGCRLGMSAQANVWN